jgi:uncharacterized protein YjiS (DUF1127 family)
MLSSNVVRTHIDRLACIDVRRPLAALAVWRERSRQRRELMTLVSDGFNFSDCGVTRALAAQEAGRFPWQAFNDQWQDAGIGRSKLNAPGQSNLPVRRRKSD